MSVVRGLPFVLLIAASSLLSPCSTASAENGMDGYIDRVLRMGIVKPPTSYEIPSDSGWRAKTTGVQTFGGYECTVDCSGHKAGYEWAEWNDIADEYDCIGNSFSFEEGCAVYVDDPYRGPDLDDDGNYIP